MTDASSSATTGSQTGECLAGCRKDISLTSLAAVTAGVGQNITLTVRDAFNNVAAGCLEQRPCSRLRIRRWILPDLHVHCCQTRGWRAFSVTLKTAGSQTVTLTDPSTATLLRRLDASRGVLPAIATSLRLAGLANAVGRNHSVSCRQRP